MSKCRTWTRWADEPESTNAGATTRSIAKNRAKDKGNRIKNRKRSNARLIYMDQFVQRCYERRRYRSLRCRLKGCPYHSPTDTQHILVDIGLLHSRCFSHQAILDIHGELLRRHTADVDNMLQLESGIHGKDLKDRVPMGCYLANADDPSILLPRDEQYRSNTNTSKEFLEQLAKIHWDLRATPQLPSLVESHDPPTPTGPVRAKSKTKRKNPGKGTYAYIAYAHFDTAVAIIQIT